MTIGSEILEIASLPSTNSYASMLIRNSAVKEGTIIRAGFQSAGRGQAGNSWESEAGMNLLLSIVLFPRGLEASRQFILSMAVSLGICDFLDEETGSVSIKWPNDIYAGNDKIAGILIENAIIGNTIESSVAGIGLNINQEKFTSGAPNPVSLSILTGKKYDLGKALERLAARLDLRYSMVQKGGHNETHSEYVSRLFRLGQTSAFTDGNGSFSGTIVSAGIDGMLRIEDEQGRTRTYGFKEVEFTL